jgi:uncharacterized protein (DUF2384 family)
MTRLAAADLSPDDQALVAKATMRAAGFLGLTNATLSKVLGVSESQVSRLARGKAPLDGKAFELGLMLVRLFRSLAGVIGDDKEAVKSWLGTPNMALGDRPIDMIQTISGLFEVVTYVDSHRAIL